MQHKTGPVVAGLKMEKESCELKSVAASRSEEGQGYGLCPKAPP